MSNTSAALLFAVIVIGIVITLILLSERFHDINEWDYYLSHPEEYDDFLLPSGMTNEQYVEEYLRSVGKKTE